jgi:hypothetical protein
VDLREAVEGAVNVGIFQMSRLRHDALSSEPRVASTLERLEAATDRVMTARGILDGLLRFAFLIEPVQRVNSAGTKMTARWFPRGSNAIEYEAFGPSDPRVASYEDCLGVFDAAVDLVLENLANASQRNVVLRMRQKGSVPYELPRDYRDLAASPLHAAGNVVGIASDRAVQRAVKLRLVLLGLEEIAGEFLLDEAERLEIATVFENKVRIKSHLTDRVTTGSFKTNREKRWEAVTASPHAASRLECLLVEWTLLGQLCAFEGFPTAARGALAGDELLPALPEGGARCPITRDTLQWDAFVREVEDPVHGTSAHHVGHLVPLKEGSSAGRHVASNVAWISSVGNRIQGNLSVPDTIELLERIRHNYEDHGPARLSET